MCIHTPARSSIDDLGATRTPFATLNPSPFVQALSSSSTLILERIRMVHWMNVRSVVRSRDGFQWPDREPTFHESLHFRPAIRCGEVALPKWSSRLLS